MRLRYTILFVFSLTLSFFAQTTSSTEQSKINPVESGKFSRKSICLVPLADSYLGKYSNEMLDASLKVYKSGRFDYNFATLPALQKAQSLYAQYASQFKYDTPTDEANLKLLHKILAESGIKKEIIQMTGNLDSLQARFNRSQKRTTTDANLQMKINSLKVQDMLLMLNGTFFGVSVLREYADANEKVKGVAFWVRLDVSNVKDWDENSLPNPDQVDIFLVSAKEISATMVSNPEPQAFNPDWSQTDIYKYETPQELAKALDVRGARQFVRQAVLLALTLDDFKIRGTIQDMSEGMRFDAGKREGVYLDQGYKAYELRMDESNKAYSEYMGFGRVETVADNTEKIDALSGLYSIYGSFDQGYSIVSHDQFMDISVKPAFWTMKVPKDVFKNPLGLPDYFANDATGAAGFTLTGMLNIAPQTNVSQLFTGISVSAALPLESPTQTYVDAKAFAFVWEANVLVHKKFWMSGVNINTTLSAGYNQLRLSWTNAAGSEYAIAYSSYGVGADLGLEFPASADVLLGADLGYRYVLGTYKLSYIKDGTEVPKDFVDNGLDLGGLRLGLHFTYSLPPIF